MSASCELTAPHRPEPEMAPPQTEATATTGMAQPKPRFRPAWRGPTPEDDAVLQRLRGLFPAAFAEDRPPLQIGIHNDISARVPDLPPDTLSGALRAWVNHSLYLACVASQRERVGLGGEPVGDYPTTEQAWYARIGLARRLRVAAEALDPRTVHPWWLRIRAIQKLAGRPNASVDLDGGDLAFVRGLLDRHPEALAKKGPGVAGIVLKPSQRGGRFFVRRTDGSEESFNPLRCIGPEPSRDLPAPRRGLEVPGGVPPEPVLISTSAKAAKVLIPIQAEQFIGAVSSARIPEGAPTAALMLRSGEVTMTVQVAGKSLRRAVKGAAAGGFVLVQGRLGKGCVVEEPGLGVQPARPPKDG